MLAQLTISNFAIVRELEIDFHSGMTASPGKPVQGNPLPLMRWGCASAEEPKPTWCAEAPAAPTCAPASP
jgi:DNA repair protein RecN (Recombination protein N)